MKSYKLTLSLIITLLITSHVQAEAITVSAAISLKDALAKIVKSYEQMGENKVVVNVGASGQIMDQIKNGAPVDVFLSAAPGQIEELEKDGLTQPGTRRVIAHNRLVLIVPASANGEIKGFDDLTKPGVKRIAIGKPKSVPAGDYATQVFEHLHLSDTLKPKLIFGANVRQVLDYVRRGEVDAGVVYSTDARVAGDEVNVVATAPETSHRPITYEGVVLKDSTHPQAGADFLQYLDGKESRQVLEGQGFEVVDKAK